MSNHTPGPWHLNGNGILLHPVTGSQLVSQKIETSLGSFEIFDETNEPDANAWLIAAAPDLLSALQECVGLLDIIWRRHDDPFGIHHNNATDAEAKARAAIAKAEGRAE